jgi:glycosyltransferase involved in cell wall biosynthesis
MKVSVITCCLNAESTITDNILSVNRQSYEDIEHLIMDGDSRDDTVSLVRRLSSRNPVIFSEKDSSALEAFNKGIIQSTGDIIGFLNGDDFFIDDDVVKKIVQIFDDPEVMGCYANVIYVDQFNIKNVKRFWRLGPYSDQALKSGWAPAHPTFYVRRSVFNTLGSFSEEFPIQSDFEFAVRFFFRYRLKASYIDESWVCMRMGGISNKSLSGILRQNYDNFRACRTHGLQVGWSYIVIRIFARLKQFFSAFLIKFIQK